MSISSTSYHTLKSTVNPATQVADALCMAFKEFRHKATLEVQQVKISVAPLDLFAWLEAQQGNHKFYWSGRDETHFIAGFDVADIQSTNKPSQFKRVFKQIEAITASNPMVRYFGGFRFGKGIKEDVSWQGFASLQFMLPRFEIHTTPEETYLLCNLIFPQDIEKEEEIIALARTLTFPQRTLEGTFQFPIQRTDFPPESVWKDKISWLLEAFSNQILQKLVLARKSVFQFENVLNPFLLLKRLQLEKPQCFHFLYQPHAHATFIAATPERLYYRKNKEIFSEAVAGTRRLTQNAQEDKQAAYELLHSEKDLREQDFVVQSITKALEKRCQMLQVDTQASLMKLTRRMHLFSGIKGILKDSFSDLDIIRALHPTPAVGGSPTDVALALLPQLEPFDRGWYAGPIGWISARAAEFAVGIRSGLVQGNTLSLFSGAGIVEGSVPQTEWQEIEDKISDFLAVLGLYA